MIEKLEDLAKCHVPYDIMNVIDENFNDMIDSEPYNYQAYNQNWKQQYIICSAIHFDDGLENTVVHKPKNIKTGYVITGRRHGDVFTVCYLFDKEKTYLKHEKTQGFLTNDNLFVDRKEAGLIAFKAGQVKNLTDCLFSEDLY